MESSRAGSRPLDTQAPPPAGGPRSILVHVDEGVHAAPGEVHFFYTTCPKCARAYGKNYVVGVAALDGAAPAG